MNPPATDQLPSCPASVPAENIEIKARLTSLDPARRVAAELATGRLADERQIDTYFRCNSGRLKLREINDLTAQLIWYRRPDQASAKPSRYLVAPVEQPSDVKNALSEALGVMATVEKRREIYMFHNVRVHLDEVRKLGCFLEFEAVLGPGHGLAECHAALARLRGRFQVSDLDLCASSYSDMIFNLKAEEVKAKACEIV